MAASLRNSHRPAAVCRAFHLIAFAGKEDASQSKSKDGSPEARPLEGMGNSKAASLLLEKARNSHFRQ